MLENRFQKVYSQVEIELAQSLPIIDHNCEIMFFYSTFPKDEYSFVVNRIEHMYKRDIVTGEITEDVGGVYSDLINACHGEIIRPSIMDDEAFVVEESYYKNYEAVYEMISKGLHIDLLVINDLLDDFEALIPEGNLKKLYKALGKQLFNMR